MKKRFFMIAAAMLGSMAFWWHSTSSSPTLVVEPPLTEQEIATLDEASVEKMQQDAARAALDAVYARPLQGPVRQRPAFVSRVEWQILAAVAAQKPEPEQELTRLVNFLRFNKQMEWWQQGDELSATQRTDLGWHLLAELPERVHNGDLASSDAQQLQIALLNELEPDPDARRQRLQQEAGRIGVTFRIESSSL